MDTTADSTNGSEAPEGDAVDNTEESGVLTDKPRGELILPTATAGLLAIGILAVLYFGRPVLIPLAAAILFSLVLRPLVRLLARISVPPPLSALLLVSILGGAVSFGIYSLKDPAFEWLDEAPRSLEQLKERMHSVTESINQVQEATEEVSKFGEKPGEESPQVVVTEATLDDQLLAEARQALAGLLTTLVLLFFILGWGERLYRNVVNSLPRFREQRQAVLIAQQVEHSIAVYLGTITIINTALGVVVGGAMYLLGMPNPVLWGVMAGVANYVPYLGPAFTAVVLAFVALLSFPTIGEALTVPAVFLFITSFEGYVITPMAVGRQLTLNPLLIMLSLMFWFWMWGVVGALLTVPSLVCLKVILERIEPVRSWARIFD